MDDANGPTANMTGQIPCPFCGQPVALPVDAVLRRQTIPCLVCGAELSVDADNSREALAMLERWRKDSEAVRQFAEPPGSANQPRETRRGKRPRRR